MGRGGPHAGFAEPEPTRSASGNRAALIEFIDRVKARVARQLGRDVRVVSCYEAGYEGFWLDRLPRQNGIGNHLINAASVEVNRRPCCHLPLLRYPNLRPFADQPDDTAVANPVLDKTDQPIVADRIEEAADVGVQDPVRLAHP